MSHTSENKSNVKKEGQNDLISLGSDLEPWEVLGIYRTIQYNDDHPTFARSVISIMWGDGHQYFSWSKNGYLTFTKIGLRKYKEALIAINADEKVKKEVTKDITRWFKLLEEPIGATKNLPTNGGEPLLDTFPPRAAENWCNFVGLTVGILIPVWSELYSYEEEMLARALYKACMLMTYVYGNSSFAKNKNNYLNAKYEQEKQEEQWFSDFWLYVHETRGDEALMSGALTEATEG